PRGQWAVGEIADSLLREPRQQLGPVGLLEQRELVLDGRHRMDRMAPLDQVTAEVRYADVPRLPGGHEFRHRAPGVLNRHAVVWPVHLVEVNVVEAEALEGS